MVGKAACCSVATRSTAWCCRHRSLPLLAACLLVLGIAGCSGSAPRAGNSHSDDTAPGATPSAQATGATGSSIFAHVPAATRAALEHARPVTAQHAMVVSDQHLATQAGLEILKQGGNAIDAAVAVGYALAVTQPCCGNIGGGGFMTIHLANGEDLFLNFREKAPLKASPNMFLDAKGNVVEGRSTDTYLGVGVPGTVMGLDTALGKYGTMSIRQVIQPAIELARNGFVLQQGDASILNGRLEALNKYPNSAAIFGHGGKPWKAGDRLVQKDLASTLEKIAKGGTDAFYKGSIARAVVEASNANGGILGMKDFATYNAEWKKPVQCEYRGYTILSAPPPSSGGTTMCLTLNILKPLPVGDWGYGSVKFVHYFAEAERRAFATRNTYLGDPDFVDIPMQKLLSAGYAASLRSTIQPDKATPSSQIKSFLPPNEGNNTTHYSVMDSQGNAVAVTYTINFLFGIKQIAGDTGFFLNDEMDDFTAKPGASNGAGLVQGKADQVEPGKRPLSSMTPTVVLKDGKPFMLSGSPGSATIISTTMQSIINVIDFGMNMQQAVNAPHVHQQWYPDVVYVGPGLLTPESKQQLEAMGYTLKERRLGVLESILVNPETGMLEGASDPHRSAGLAAGY
ncbi:MAG TPA: gamma-glutamyltransferase [Rhodanobacteraceae bacterium]|nr:gamma-glutamyltransferase [Oleiagrimonas sp.]HET9818025.1 gamma-glutamyltransferase [Rhodanobacteraceae bacterium]